MTTMEYFVDRVRKGDFPEVPIPEQERVTTMDMQLLANYSIILGSCLLNGIPEKNSEYIYEKRRDLYDEIMETVNKRNFGRTLKLNLELSEIVNQAALDNRIWPSQRERNNVLLFAVQYFLWDDKVRAEFFSVNNDDVSDEGNDAEPAPAAE